MRQKHDSLSAAAIVKKIASLFGMPIYELDGALLTGDPKRGKRHAADFPGDPIALEAFVNHYHLSDYVGGCGLEPRAHRQMLTSLADAVVLVWSERLAKFLVNRSVLFFVGGTDDVIVRFHVEREGGAAWAPLEPAFLRKERIRVFRATSDGLERIV